MLARKSLNLLLICAIFGSLLAFAPQGDAWGQFGESGRGNRNREGGGFNVRSILERIDTNRNGILEPAEMSGRTQEFVRAAGLDPNRPHAIQTVVTMLENRNRGETPNQNQPAPSNNQAKTARNAANPKPNSDRAGIRKVPGFGVTTELVGISDFSPSGEERMSEEQMQRKFGNAVMSQVEMTMKRFDTDKNGLLDPTEQQRTRWTEPSADASDTNKDGNLSRLELAYRFQEQHQRAADRKANHANRGNVANPGANTNQGQVAADPNRLNVNIGQTRANRGSTATAGRAQNFPQSNSASTVGTRGGSQAGFSSSADAYKRYVEGLMNTYDTNKDQRLSKEELAEMRRPPTEADANGDGFVDKQELINYYTQRSTSKTNLDQQAPNQQNVSVNPVERIRRSSNVSYNETDSVFGGRDVNHDGQLQMWEFAQEWNEETVAQFKEKDLNGDGVITAQEWRGER